MKLDSILLAIDGSIYSRFAAGRALEIASVTGAAITAAHILDLNKAWQSIGFDSPGFLRESDYVAEFEALSRSLCNLGHRLLEAFAAEAQATGVSHKTVLDRGTPYDAICRMALNHDLVVIGHRPFMENQARNAKTSVSFAESMAHGCPRPLLIVQAPALEDWSSVAAAVSMDHINTNYLNSVIDLSDDLGIRPSVVCVSTGANEKSFEEFKQDLIESVPLLEGVPLVQEVIENVRNTRDFSPEQELCSYPWDFWQTPLLIAPTREVGGQRLTLADASPEMVVRYCSLPALMLYPEDSPHLIGNPLSQNIVVNPQESVS